MSEQRYKRHALLPKLRKWTTPIHWVYGALCVFLILSHGILAGWFAMGALAGMEIWNDKEERAHNPAYLPTGCTDWWEAFIIFMPGNGVLALLNYLEVITVTWLGRLIGV